MNQTASEASGARTQAAQPGRAAFVFIFITVLLDMLALGIIIPVLPAWWSASWAATRRAAPKCSACSAPPGR